MDAEWCKTQDFGQRIAHGTLIFSVAIGMTAGEIIDDECRFLESVKERLLVLFEGFQSPNNTHIEAKVDLTLNFLEYLLSSIDSRIENIKKSGH